MRTKNDLLKQNEYLKQRLEEQRKEIKELNNKLYMPKNSVDFDLQAKYLVLMNKYSKLMDICSSSETEYITYNGELYSIKSIDYHKEPDSVDSININAIHIPREKGLVDNLTEPFKNVAKELNKMFFGNKE